MDGEGQRRGGARWWERHVTPQPEHMPSRWCLGFAGRRRRDGDKTPGCAAGTQGPHDDDVFCLFLQIQKIGAKLHIYLWEGIYGSPCDLRVSGFGFRVSGA